MGVAGDQRLSHAFTRESPTVLLRCRNCDAELTGAFCARCGQRDLPPNPTFRELFAEAWDAFVSIDGKFLQSMRLLLRRPGELTVRYLEGKRAAYLPPLRLYLMCSVAFFLVQAAAPEGSASTLTFASGKAGTKVLATPFDSSAAQGSAAALRLRNGMRNAVQDKDGFKVGVRQYMPNAMFLLVPVYALLLGVAYRDRKRNLPAHLVFALHTHAVLFTVFLVSTTAKWLLPRVGQAVEALGFAALVVYFPAALRRVYDDSWRGAITRSAVTLLPYMMATGAVMIGLLVVSFWMAGAPHP